jgi:hypothetical protein
MSTGGQPSGLGQDQARIQIPAAAPCQPSIANRVVSLEDRETNSEQRLLKAEQVILKLITECHEYRAQLGLPPLTEDYFIS